MTTLSVRARRLVAEPSPLVTAHFQAVTDPYHPELNPHGYVNLGTAQNHLLWDLLEPILRAPRQLVASDVNYQPMYGMEALRIAIADFLNRTHGASVDPDDLVVVTGASTALDILAYALCEPGEGIAVPTPYYNGLEVDFTGRAAAQVVRIGSSSADDFALNAGAVETALRDAERNGIQVRALTLVSPNNPLGRLYSPKLLDEMAELAGRHGLALIFDEMYGASVFGDKRFQSSLTLSNKALPADRIHTVWGFGKDFGLSGFRVGVLHTRSPEVRAAARELAYLSPVSTDTQVLLRDLLTNRERADAFVAENQRRLGESYRTASALLRAEGIPHIPAEAGLFLWMDLRKWLSVPSPDAEFALWQRFFNEARVSISPGTIFRCTEPGWFRLCHAVGETDLREGITRVGNALRSAPQPALTS